MTDETTDEGKINRLLQKLKLTDITWTQIEAHIADEKKGQVKAFLLRIANHLDTISVDRSLIINWQSLIFKEQSLEKAFPPESAIARFARYGDTTMTGVYVILNGLAFSLAIVPLLHGHISPEVATYTGSLGVGQSWNHIDTVGGYGVALNQYLSGQTFEATVNCVSSTQLLGCTLAGILGEFAFHTVSTAASSSLLGFSFAACMFFAAYLENEAAKTLAKELEAIQDKISGKETSTEDRKHFEQLYLLKKAQLDEHLQNRNIWISCGVAMLAVAIIGVSVATMGTPLIAVAICAGVAFASGVIRAMYLNSSTRWDNLKSMEAGKLATWFNLLNGATNNKVHPSNSEDGNAKADIILNLRDTMASLCQNNPAKAAKLIDAIRASFTNGTDTPDQLKEIVSGILGIPTKQSIAEGIRELGPG